MKPRTSSPHRTVSLGTFFWSLHSQPTRVCSRRCLHMSSSSQTHALALRQQVAQFEKTVDPSNSSQVAALNDMRKALSDLERTRGVWSNPASTNERDWNAAPASAPSANSSLGSKKQKDPFDPRYNEEYQAYKQYKAKQQQFDEGVGAPGEGNRARKLAAKGNSAAASANQQRVKKARDEYFKMRGLEFND